MTLINGAILTIMTTYFVKMQHKFADDIRSGRSYVSDFRIIDYITGTHEELVLSANDTFRPEEIRLGVGTYLCEDDLADRDLEGKTVEPQMRQRDVDFALVVSGRTVIE